MGLRIIYKSTQKPEIWLCIFYSLGWFGQRANFEVPSRRHTFATRHSQSFRGAYLLPHEPSIHFANSWRTPEKKKRNSLIGNSSSWRRTAEKKRNIVLFSRLARFTSLGRKKKNGTVVTKNQRNVEWGFSPNSMSFVYVGSKNWRVSLEVFWKKQAVCPLSMGIHFVCRRKFSIAHFVFVVLKINGCFAQFFR